MTTLVTGATGFIGRRLIQRLARDRHQLHALSRHTNTKFGDTAVWISKWDPMTEEPPEESIANADAIVHLAGEPVAQRPFNDSGKPGPRGLACRRAVKMGRPCSGIAKGSGKQGDRQHP